MGVKLYLFTFAISMRMIEQVRGQDLTPATETLSMPSLLQTGSWGKTRLDGWTNKLIWGDNLEALELLLREPSIRGQVRLVYIDPPYATNQEFRVGESRTSTVSSSYDDRVAYEDRLAGEAYLRFLRDRLILIKEILAEDGSIYVHVDIKVGHYLKVLMDEIFGASNFINQIIRVKCNPKNFSRRGYGNIHDMILFYSKGSNFVWNESRESLSDADIQRLFPKVDKYGRRYTTTPLHAPGETRKGATGMPWRGINPPKGRHWRYPPEELDRLDKEGLIEWSPTGNPRKILYADEVRLKGRKRQDVWEFKDPPYPVYPTEKNIEMLKVIIQASSNPDDIVMDCFSGSGTTLVAAELLGRRWIGIDSSEVAIQMTQKKFFSMNNFSAFETYIVKSAMHHE